MNYCRFTVLALERAGWAGVPRFQAGHAAPPPTMHGAPGGAGGGGLPTLPQCEYACNIWRLDPRQLCCSHRG